jgi:PPOX class probable F420-dependent enzyme
VDLSRSELLEFWAERHLCTLTTLRPDGSPHVVAIGATLDAPAGIVRVITRRGSVKVRNVRAAAVASFGDKPAVARAAICQVDGRRWSTAEGTAVIREDPESVADAERRYAERYRVPQPNPERVVIEVTITRMLGL